MIIINVCYCCCYCYRFYMIMMIIVRLQASSYTWILYVINLISRARPSNQPSLDHHDRTILARQLRVGRHT